MSIFSKFSFALFILTTVLIALMGWGLFVGELSISVHDIFIAITEQNHKRNTSHWAVLELRSPRIIMAILVGCALALSGAILQGITRNDLADPSIIGINQGAAMMAVIALVVFKQVSTLALALAAFLGGVLVALMIYLTAWREGSSPARIVLVGIGMAALTFAITSLLISMGNILNVEQAYLWLSGSLYKSDWPEVKTMLLCSALIFPCLYLFIPQLNTLLLEDDSAKSIGQHIEIARGFGTLLSVILASVAVSLVGGMGFIGLLAPHLARQWVGCNFAKLLPISALIGACLLLVADILGRIIIQPYEIPAGLVVAIIGTPYFAFMLIKNRSRI